MTVKVGPWGQKAIEHILPKAEEELRTKFPGKAVTKRDCIEILGYKELRKKYGKVYVEELAKILNLEKNTRRRW